MHKLGVELEIRPKVEEELYLQQVERLGIPAGEEVWL